jgi:hypothetical protein
MFNDLDNKLYTINNFGKSCQALPIKVHIQDNSPRSSNIINKITQTQTNLKGPSRIYIIKGL